MAIYTIILSTAVGQSAPVAISSIHPAFSRSAPVNCVWADEESARRPYVDRARSAARPIFDRHASWPAVNESPASRLFVGI